MKKAHKTVRNIFAVVALAAVMALPFGLAACSLPAGGGDKFGDLTTPESVYGFSAASAGILISAMNDNADDLIPGGDITGDGTTSETPPADETVPETPPAGETTPETPPAGETTPETPPANDGLSELDGYMSLIDSLLADGGFSTSVTASDRAEYAEKMTVTYTDIGGNANSYVMYYNELLIPDDDDDDWDDWDEIEEEYVIYGVMVIDGADYEIRGERSYEEDGGETESETEFRVTLGENKYMYVEQGYESEFEHGDNSVEQEYSYIIRERGRVVESSTFSYETERGETELKMSAYRDGKTTMFTFDRETVRGREVIRLRIGSGRDVRSYLVNVVTSPDGTVHYEYTEYSFGR